MLSRLLEGPGLTPGLLSQRVFVGQLTQTSGAALISSGVGTGLVCLLSLRPTQWQAQIQSCPGWICQDACSFMLLPTLTHLYFPFLPPGAIQGNPSFRTQHRTCPPTAYTDGSFLRFSFGFSVLLFAHMAVSEWIPSLVSPLGLVHVANGPDPPWDGIRTSMPSRKIGKIPRRGKP